MLSLRKKWDTLKATYIRSKKKTASGSGAAAGKPYRYREIMSYLDDTEKPRDSNQLGGVELDTFTSDDLKTPQKSN